jgi:hypothetical protein
MKGNISKEMAKKVKRRESIKLELGGNQLALKIDYGEKKKKKMVVILFDKRKISFFGNGQVQVMEWAKHVDIFCLLSVQLSSI